MTEVLHKCGHTGSHRIFGTEEARAKRIAELESGDCSGCWLKKQPPNFVFVPLPPNGSVSVGHFCYPIREELSVRGYRFSLRAWRKKLTTEAEQEAERQWLAERGFVLGEYVERQRKPRAEKRAARVKKRAGGS